ncbi:hypothetical protein DVB88_05850 [Tsukamurella pulmonis]|nr:hypothetical protein DVB88_05850 [Tsukamurella pulmonis]
MAVRSACASSSVRVSRSEAATISAASAQRSRVSRPPTSHVSASALSWAPSWGIRTSPSWIRQPRRSTKVVATAVHSASSSNRSASMSASCATPSSSWRGTVGLSRASMTRRT